MDRTGPVKENRKEIHKEEEIMLVGTVAVVCVVVGVVCGVGATAIVSAKAYQKGYEDGSVDIYGEKY